VIAVALTATGSGQYRLTGDLDFASVVPLVLEGERVFAASPRVRIDLQGVGQANSAGLALLLEWVEQAKRRDRHLELVNLPESLARIARITNLAGLLPLGTDAATQLP
jgi:phospholipid transport system transporter-binding protein